jgi:putative phosphoribosyl transferase
MYHEKPFHNRTDAGRQLAARLAAYRLPSDTLILGLPRGGVVVAFEVADALDLPLDVFVVRKLGVPQQPELALGAVATGGTILVNEDLVRRVGVSQAEIERVAATERRELERRERAYRDDVPAPDLEDRTVVVVDDGLATGATMQAAVSAIRKQHPRHLMVAVPVAAQESCGELKSLVDDIVCMITPPSFYAVGQWYEIFDQTSDDEVRSLLQKARREVNAGRGRP